VVAQYEDTTRTDPHNWKYEGDQWYAPPCTAFASMALLWLYLSEIADAGPHGTSS